MSLRRPGVSGRRTTWQRGDSASASSGPAGGQTGPICPAGPGMSAARSSASATSTRSGLARRRRSTARVATGDYRDLLKRDDIDVIDVVTRDSEHFEINMAAIEAGKHVLSEKPVAHDHPRRPAGGGTGPVQGPEDQGRPDLPLQPGRPVPEGPDRARRPGHALHLQRLRAELAVAEPADAAAQQRARQRRPDQGRLAGRLRRPGHRHRPLAHGLRPHRSRRRAAQLRPRAHDRRHRPDGAHEHRRRRHLHRRVRQRRDLLGADQLRHRRQLPRHRGARLRQRGRGDRPAGRGVRHLRDAQDGQARRRGVPRGRGTGQRTTRRAAARASRGGRCTTRT